MEGGRLKDLFPTPHPPLPPEGGQEGGESLGEKFCKESNFLQHVLSNNTHNNTTEISHCTK